MLMQFPPMGVYETLFKFADATNKYMGDPGTHPWAQGYPLTTQIPGGPPLPASVSLTATDLKYPKATGEIELRSAIAEYFNTHYSAGITPEHVAIFAGGRPGILATLAFLEADFRLVIRRKNASRQGDERHNNEAKERMRHGLCSFSAVRRRRFRHHT